MSDWQGTCVRMTFGGLNLRADVGVDGGVDWWEVTGVASADEFAAFLSEEDIECPPLGEDLDGIVGHWKGDRIAVVGDYAENGDLAEEHGAESIYRKCSEGVFKDISEQVAPMLEAEFGRKFVGDGWRQFTETERT